MLNHQSEGVSLIVVYNHVQPKSTAESSSRPFEGYHPTFLSSIRPLVGTLLWEFLRDLTGCGGEKQELLLMTFFRRRILDDWLVVSTPLKNISQLE